MKYLKYILVIATLYFGIKLHNTYLSYKTEIQSIEDAYKDELSRKLIEYNLNSENITFHHDSVSLSIDQKYLALIHEIDIQYLRGDFDIKIYEDSMQKLREREWKETSDNFESWTTENEGITMPKTPIPELLIERRKSSGEQYRFSFILCGIMTFFFLLVDVLTWLKDRPQIKYPIRANQPHSPLNKQINKQIVSDGQTMTRQKVQLDNGETIYKLIDVDGSLAEVPAATTAKWDKVLELTDNTMIRDGRTLTRLPEGQREYPDGEFWRDEQDQTIHEVSTDEIKEWESAKQSGIQNPDVVSITYGKTQVTGMKDEAGNFLVSEPLGADRAEALKSEVVRVTGGRCTIKADSIEVGPNSPEMFQVKIIPYVAPKTHDELAPPPEDAMIQGNVIPRNVKPMNFGNTTINIAEDTDFDEVIPSEKVPLEKALPILEKKFKDNKKFKLQVEKSEVEIPGETKWDDPTFKTVVKSIRIVPIGAASPVAEHIKHVNISNQEPAKVPEIVPDPTNNLPV